jgi:hypothetical protein
MEVPSWSKALADTEFFGKCDKQHVAGERGCPNLFGNARTFNLFCVQCATKVSLCCKAKHLRHTLLQVSRRHANV